MKIGNGEFWLGDCLERMRDIPDGSVDMVVTSPPYDDIRTYNDTNDWCFDVFQNVAAELTRVLTDGGVIVWNVGDATTKGSETGSSFRQALHFKDVCGLRLHDTMIWQKPNFNMPQRNRYHQVFEYMFVLSKGAPRTFNPIKDRKNKYPDGPWGKNSMRNADGKMIDLEHRKSAEFGARFNVWYMNSTGQSGCNPTDHPATFPVQLAHDHILSWSNPNDLILDPFGGSGTTAIAAERTGRRWLCIEREPSYYYPAVGRVWGEVSAR